MKLNLGCGMRHMPEYINVDRHSAANPDLLCDLELMPWPWNDNSADVILLTHVLEHLGQTPNAFLQIMQELYRVLKPLGNIVIKVPHHHCDNFWNDPTHVRVINPSILSLFSKKNCLKYIEDNAPNTPLALYLNIDLELTTVSYALLPPYAERWTNGEMQQQELDHLMTTFWNVVDEITMVLTKPLLVP
jgi:SAM-dependent methyltransferase